MRLAGVRVGWGLTGSHCTLGKVIFQAESLRGEGADIYPILSPAVQENDTRFGTASFWWAELVRLTGREPITSIVAVEPIGPQGLLDVMLIAPCTGNTLAKLVNGIVDTPVLMAAKATMRNQKPVVLAVATNDGLGMNAKNLGLALSLRGVYLVPFGQDDPLNKSTSIIAHMDLLLDTVCLALEGRQIQPLLRSY